MANQRLFFPLCLMFLAFLIWEAWQKDYGPQTSPNQTATVGASASSVPVTAGSANDIPTKPLASVTDAAGEKPTSSAIAPVSQRVRVETDVFSAELDSLGADLRSVRLRNYTVSVDDRTPMQLMSDSGTTYFIAQTGFIAANNLSAPTHYEQFSSAQTSYNMGDAQTLEVPLVWDNGKGLKLTKTYVFTRGSYAIEVRNKLENTSGQDWVGSLYTQLQRSEAVSVNHMMPVYTGGVIYTVDQKYEKMAFDDLAKSPLDRKAVGGWAAMIQHYFVSAWVPPQGVDYQFYGKSLGDKRYQLGMVWPAVSVPDGKDNELRATLYVGPKDQNVLETIAPGLELTVDYGTLTVIAKPLFWLMQQIHSLVGNWGVAIILLTMVVKAVFFKLSEKSYKSMASMRKLQPKLQALKERYGDDKDGFKTAMMKLYQEEKINPFGGCLPMLVQMPVFLALYWVLLESVEMRQAPFILWINDLSVSDPYFVLPLLMGASMFLQQKLNPAAIDPIQQKVMMMMPVVFTAMFLFFPSGLVLYWVVNNTLSIIQQWVIMHRVDGPRASRR